MNSYPFEINGTITQDFYTPVDYIAGRTKHEAIDVVTSGSKPIHVKYRCVVTDIVNTYDYLPNSGFGNRAFVLFENGDIGSLAHLKRDSMPAIGTQLEVNDIVGWTGQTGYRFPIETWHTHIEQIRDGKRIDPLDPANEPAQPKPNYKATMQLFKKAQQMIWTKVDGIAQYWIIWLKDDGTETKRLVAGSTGSMNRAIDIFSGAGKYFRWSTPEQLELLSRLPQGEDFDINVVVGNHPELLEQ